MTIDDDGVIMMPHIRTRYNYDMDEASRASGLFCTDETRAQQQFKDECDINTIVKQFGITGTLPTNLQVPLMYEFIDVMDYQTALNKIMEADKAFMEMPADVREQFQNNAGRFVDFVSDPKNLEQCQKWGIAKDPYVPPSVAPEGAPSTS